MTTQKGFSRGRHCIEGGEIFFATGNNEDGTAAWGTGAEMGLGRGTSRPALDDAPELGLNLLQGWVGDVLEVLRLEYLRDSLEVVESVLGGVARAIPRGESKTIYCLFAVNKRRKQGGDQNAELRNKFRNE